MTKKTEVVVALQKDPSERSHQERHAIAVTRYRGPKQLIKSMEKSLELLELLLELDAPIPDRAEVLAKRTLLLARGLDHEL